jgi:GTPase SAR1 family protein
MGCTSSNLSPEELERRKKNQDLDQNLRAERSQEDEKIKLLLLGAGESGKSTIFKQMKVIYGDQYTEAERRQHVPTVHSNVIQAMKVLIEQTIVFNLVNEIVAKDAFDLIKSIDDSEVIDLRVGGAIKALWKDPGMNMVWARRAEFQVIESVQYYFNRIDIIMQPDYLPDKDDIIYSRVRTSGIVTERYLIDNTVFEMYDVGGQRNERKKWIHCFEGVTAVIFVAAISEYDQKLFEDASTNRMVEALELFEDICNNIFFMESSMILFLNKRDLFAEKIKTRNIRETPAFSDYSGKDGDYDAGVAYFLDKFLAKNKSGTDRQIYHHVTCATDTGNVKVVFNACKDIVLRANIRSGGFSVE